MEPRRRCRFPPKVPDIIVVGTSWRTREQEVVGVEVEEDEGGEDGDGSGGGGGGVMFMRIVLRGGWGLFLDSAPSFVVASTSASSAVVIMSSPLSFLLPIGLPGL